MAYSYFTQGVQGPAVDQIFDLLVQLLPRGAARFYGLDRKAGDVWNYFMGIAETMKAFAFDAIATLKKEINPATAVYLLPEYEQWLGLSQTTIALTGTSAQRQAQVISKLREQGAATVNNVQAILAPLLGMFPANVQVIESNQTSITTAHTYNNATGASIGANSSVTQTVFVNDSGTISDAGAQVKLTITSTNPEQLSFVLTSPTGATYSMPAGSIPAGALTSTAVQVNFTAAANASMGPATGTWLLQISTGAATCTLVSWSLFVEGIGPGQDTAGARFWYGVYADPAHLGETGTAANFAAARAAIARISPAHAQGRLLQSITGAYPNTTSGVHAAIPDECLLI